MTAIRVNKRENPFVQIDKTFVENPKLKWASKGLMMYLLSRPDGWKVNQADLVKRANDGETTVRSALWDLMLYGYVYYYAERNANGTVKEWIYEIYESPELNPHQEEAQASAREKISEKKKKTKVRNNKNQKNEKYPERDNHALDKNQENSPERDYPVLDKLDLDKQDLNNHAYSNNESSNIDLNNIDLEEEELIKKYQYAYAYLENKLEYSHFTILDILKNMKEKQIENFTDAQMLSEHHRMIKYVEDSNKEIRAIGQFFVDGILMHEDSRTILYNHHLREIERTRREQAAANEYTPMPSYDWLNKR
ncbi:MAG: hypothetical protein K0Q87_175 [Neobacillus sp.]|jgi:DNA mismatch repair ATPase MutL|nr:hypothetical protein [Neobacillus sp.]